MIFEVPQVGLVFVKGNVADLTLEVAL